MDKKETTASQGKFSLTLNFEDGTINANINGKCTLEQINMLLLTSLLRYNMSEIERFGELMKDSPDKATQVLTFRRTIYQHLDDNMTYILDQIDPSVVSSEILENTGAVSAVKKQLNKDKMAKNKANFDKMVKFPKK